MKLIQKNDIENSVNRVYLQLENGVVSGVIPENIRPIFEAYKASEQFESKAGTTFINQWMENAELHTAIIIQAGEGNLKHTQKAGKAAVQAIKAHKFESVDIDLTNVDEFENKYDVVRVLTEAISLSAYKFDTYKSVVKKALATKIGFVFEESSWLVKAFEEGSRLGEATNLAKRLVNEPANVMLPEAIAVEAALVGQKNGFEVKILHDAEIEALNMPAYLAVAKASENRPRLIVMEYKGNPDESDEILGLVGKGLSFDTGGYSLKPATSMMAMKSDMGGAAAVIGAMAAIAGQNLKINVTAVVAACENMISGGAYRPGDIINSRGGKTIFIKSTDAEGRLTLIDAIDYIIKDLKVKRVVDVATLTGAQIVALGGSVTGAVSNNDAFWSMMESASEISGEKVWRMPLFEEIIETIKHKEADLTNAVREAGMITAGAFIGEFVGETPWIHLDIAGPSWTEKPLGLTSYGATGAGVRNLYFLAKSFE